MDRRTWLDLLGLLLLDSQTELVDGVLESLLVQQELSAMLPNEYLSATNHRSFTTPRHPLVVERLGPLREVFEDLSESDHALPDLADLVLADGLLDVGKDKVLVELGRLVVIGRRLGVLGRDKVD